MPPKIKIRPAGEPVAIGSVKPLRLHDVTRQTASAKDAARHRLIAIQPASGTANHARHHVPQKAQA